MESRKRLSVAIIGSARFGIGEPFAGGLEAHTATLARALRGVGHRVTIYAGSPNSIQPSDLDVRPILEVDLDYSGTDRSDNAMVAGRWQADDDGYRRVLAEVAVPGRFDVVHNLSLHYLPVILANSIEAPVVHALHCPPFAELFEAHRQLRTLGPGRSRQVVAVSKALAETWHGLATDVVHNGVDTERWTYGDGGDDCVWVGRIVAEKGPHLAIDAARDACRRITLAGPIQHQRYFDDEVRPRLGPDARWVGHLDGAELVELCGRAAVGLVTPCWEEPFGLVAAEFLACGTPVAAFDRGALGEIVAPEVGALAPAGDVIGLADAIGYAARLDRRLCRKHAVNSFSDEAMSAGYEGLYRAARTGVTPLSPWPGTGGNVWSS